ncbi:hypothetical protein AB0I84_22665 [Streptomyces spectabilis]|uniref:hypothetical protein n=1 Tax=Streptomyces spectabilis TaxID=68270 RepID=UPI0033C49196
MADAALLGSLAAVGGAIIGGTAAIVGPLLLHRRSNETQETERSRAIKEAEIERIVRLRTSTREWHELLIDAFDKLKMGVVPEADGFEAGVAAARREVSEAVDAVLHDGLWVFGGGRLLDPDTDDAPEEGNGRGIQPYPPPITQPPPIPSSRAIGYGYPERHPPSTYTYSASPYGGTADHRNGSDHLDQGPVVVSLNRATRAIRRCIISGEAPESLTLVELQESLDMVSAARGRLVTHLFNRIESITGSGFRSL